MARVYNFSAGPAVLPEKVLQKAASELVEYQGTGMSVMEMSHRSKPYDAIHSEAEALLRELMNIPDNYYDRMNLLYDLILMVFADEVIEKKEIEFVEDVAKRFGMKKDVVHWLIKVFEKGIPPIAGEWDEIKREARERFMLKSSK